MAVEIGAISLRIMLGCGAFDFIGERVAIDARRKQTVAVSGEVRGGIVESSGGLPGRSRRPEKHADGFAPGIAHATRCATRARNLG